MCSLNILDLCTPSAYPHPVEQVRLIETHISWVLLAGEFAYKIKKPVNLGFLDFSTLAKRRFCCEEEIRLNCRLAPEVYLDVVGISERDGILRIGETNQDQGNIVEWAVRMRAFPTEATLDREAHVTAVQIDAVVDRIARFHAQIDTAPVNMEYGTPAAILQPAHENISQIRVLQLDTLAKPALLDQLEAWSEHEAARLHAHFSQRKRDGFVRECHGDLHLGNIAWVDNTALIFDGIEFNPGLRFIDVISEMAFLCMDLMARSHADLAWRALNRWLEHTGDYAGMTVFRFYLVYRALVRAKVAGIRASQVRQADPHAADEMKRYLDLALAFTQPPIPILLLMHGFSGSGKSWASQALLEHLGAIRLRSDVERKRLFGLNALQASDGSSLYRADATEKTFTHLQRLVETLLDSGFQVIVDATFLQKTRRTRFIELARQRGIAARIVSLKAEPALLRKRISERQQAGHDASEATLAVLEMQLAHFDPLDAAEQSLTMFLPADQTATWPAQFARNLPAH